MDEPHGEPDGEAETGALSAPSNDLARGLPDGLSKALVLHFEEARDLESRTSPALLGMLRRLLPLKSQGEHP